MSDALPLPPRPNLEQYKRLARELQQACRSGEGTAIHDWAERWVASLARLHGVSAAPEAQRRWLQSRWHKLKETQPRASRCLLTDAQFFIARAHGFESWPKFAGHLQAAERLDSPVSQFEAAADAIASGDAAQLTELLRANPELARARSTREHRSTLLHYVSANGIEDYRQRTPANIVDLARMLLDAGADVNAESEAYGGRSTPLGLTATSGHPENAGVQIPLMELLLAHGAMIDRPDGGSAVNSCLRNGRGPAAEFLARHGARLDLEGAAGVGRLDLVAGFFQEDGGLPTGVTEQQAKDGFAWACQFGRTPVIDFLLERGIELHTKLRHHGQTGLHWAAYGGHAGAVRALLARGAAVDTKDDTYDGTPLDWALHAWGNARGNGAEAGRARYYEVVAELVRAGARLEQGAENVRNDPRMLAALRGESTG
jgi:ankyrin repeat protein